MTVYHVFYVPLAIALGLMIGLSLGRRNTLREFAERERAEREREARRTARLAASDPADG